MISPWHNCAHCLCCPRFLSASGLLLVAAAISSPLFPSAPRLTAAWAPPLGMAHRRRPAITTAAGAVKVKSSPTSTTTCMISNTASSSGQHPLAEEGDWAAYLDESYGRVYYFNHATGESTWDPPTPTFPVLEPVDGPPVMGGPVGTMGRPMIDEPMMMDGPMMDDPLMMGRGPGLMGADGGPDGMMGPGPNNMRPGRNNMGPQGQQKPHQQSHQPTYYETLQVPPTASRAQIKQAYLAFAKLYDARMDGGRRSREFNEIARAWMVLSDGRLRERYDSQLEQWERERRMREKLMEEERQWLIDQQGQSMMGTDNKFAKDPVYKKKVELIGDNTSDEFGRAFRPRSNGGGMDGVGSIHGQRSFGAWPPEIKDDVEKEATVFQQDQQEAVMQAEREELMRKKQEAEAQLMQEQARERQQRMVAERKREERRRASSERDVIQDRPKKQKPMMQPSGQDMNSMMDGMKKRFSQKKMDEATRVQQELSRLQGVVDDSSTGGCAAGGSDQGGTPFASPIGEQSNTRHPPKRTPGGIPGPSLLFPNKGGIVAEDSPFVAKDILLDKFLDRETSTDSRPSFISWVPPEEGTSGTEAAKNIQAAMSNIQVGGSGGGGGAGASMSGEQEREQERLQKIKNMGKRQQQQQQQKQQDQQLQQQQGPGGGFGDQLKFGPTPKTSSKSREQERLLGMKAMGIGGRGPQLSSSTSAERTTLWTERTNAKSSSDVREQQRLQDMGARVGMGGGMGGRQKQQQQSGGPSATTSRPTGPKHVNARELEEAQRTDMARLKSEMEQVASKTMEKEIIKIAKIHATEITKLRSEFEASRAQLQQAGGSKGEAEAAVKRLKMDQAAERERMRADIAREVEETQTKKIAQMQAAHKAEMDQILAESAGGGETNIRLQAEIEDLKQSQIDELEDMATRHDNDMAQIRSELEAKSAEMAKVHRLEIQKLKQDQKTVSVAHTLKYQQVAMDKLNGQHQQEMQSLVDKHRQEIEKLRKDLEVKSAQDMQVRVDDVTKSMAEQHKADMKEMATQHRQEMQTLVQSEIQILQAQHAREMDKALAEKRRLHQQAESVKHELSKAEGKGGGPTASMTQNQKIEMVLKSFEGVYDPVLIEQLRKDLQAWEEELSRRITESNRQISRLQSQLDTSRNVEEKLTNEIRTLAQWKKRAEEELERAKQSMDGQNKEVVGLNDQIRSMTNEIAELKAQLICLTKERDSSKQEIWELREWKKNAEAERKRLEKDLELKVGVIAKLNNDFSKRDEDVNVLVPEVARLQELTALLKQLNEKRSEDFELLKEEVERLRAQYEKESKSAADMAQSLKGELSDEQTKNSKLIDKLQSDIESKQREMSQLQSTANERSWTIAEMKSKLESYRDESKKSINASKKKIALMNADFERQLAKGKPAHKAQLEELTKKLQGDMQRLQQDLTSRSNVITDLKMKLDASSKSNRKLSGEIVCLNTHRQSTDSLLRQSSRDLDASRQEVECLKEQMQAAQKSTAANVANIKGLQRGLDEKNVALEYLRSGVTKFALEKERLIVDLEKLRLWKDSAQSALNALYNQVALNARSDEIVHAKEGRIDNVIEKLSGIQKELSQKDVQLGHTKSATDALLKGEESQDEMAIGSMIKTRSPSQPAASDGATWTRKVAVPSINVIGDEFSSRQKNIAITREKTSTVDLSTRSAQSETLKTKGVSQSPKTVTAYDVVLEMMQKSKTTSEGPIAGMTEASPAPMSRWAGGGYLDNLSPKKEALMPVAQYAADEYRKAEKQYLREAKALGQVKSKSFEEERQKKAKFNELLAKANEMKEKAEQSFIGP